MCHSSTPVRVDGSTERVPVNDISPLPLLPPLRVCGRACVNFFCVRACASSATGASLSQPKGLVPFFLLLSDPSSLYLLLALLFLLYLNGLFVFCIVFCVSSHQLIAVTHTPLPCFFFFFLMVSVLTALQRRLKTLGVHGGTKKTGGLPRFCSLCMCLTHFQLVCVGLPCCSTFLV